ncbi:MAG TPA: FHA domain-containing protein [Planctomycetota bacterium]|nr:FHA domain-containing protein [Planctomycetota bacterium]
MKATLLAKSGLTDRREYALDEGKSYLVGRSREADVIVKDKLASRSHCKVAATGAEEWTVADLGSSNGTYVNRERITTRALRHGDTIQIGKAALEFRLLSATTAPTVVGPQAAEEEASPAAGTAPREPAAPPPRTPPPLPPKAAATPPAAPPKAAPPQPASSPRPKEGVDEDIRGLFEFLDKVDKAGKPPGEAPLPVVEVEDDSPPKLRDERTPPMKLRKDTDGGPLFSLLDEVESQKPLRKRPQPPPQPPPAGPAAPAPPKPAEEGGLLAFLRKKKQQP